MTEYVLILTKHKTVEDMDVVSVGTRYHKPCADTWGRYDKPICKPHVRNMFTAITRSLAERAGLKACRKCWRE